jgi:cyclophilin family peptidyl-prolyl cis-trans isomerase
VTKAKVRAAEPPDDFEVPEEWRRRPWTALAIVGVVLLVMLGPGLAFNKGLQPNVPSALAKCTTSTQLGPHAYSGLQPMCINTAKHYQATIVTSAGTVVVALNASAAPVTVNNFVVLAINGFYNGLTFWRVESWVVQTGDPDGNGRGGPGYTLPEEPAVASWPVGSLGMARPPGGAISGSQFFITTQTWPGTGPQGIYNGFGTVTSGIDKVQGMTSSDRVSSITIKVS